MEKRWCKMGNVMVVIAIVVAALPVTAQNWTAPRTPWGDPDLQGLWLELACHEENYSMPHMLRGARVGEE